MHPRRTLCKTMLRDVITFLQPDPEYFFFKQTLLNLFLSNPDFKIFITIVIVIEMEIRINQTLI